MSRFIALRHLKTMKGMLKPGDYVLDASRWPQHIQISEVQCGNVYDLKREVVLQKDDRTKNRRENALLAELRAYGKEVVAHPERPGEMMVQELHPELADDTQPVTAEPAHPADGSLAQPEVKKGRGGRRPKAQSEARA